MALQMSMATSVAAGDMLLYLKASVLMRTCVSGKSSGKKTSGISQSWVKNRNLGRGEDEMSGGEAFADRFKYILDKTPILRKSTRNGLPPLDRFTRHMQISFLRGRDLVEKLMRTAHIHLEQSCPFRSDGIKCDGCPQDRTGGFVDEPIRDVETGERSESEISRQELSYDPEQLSGKRKISLAECR
jgi:hypothetical protein